MGVILYNIYYSFFSNFDDDDTLSACGEVKIEDYIAGVARLAQEDSCEIPLVEASWGGI
mgnify:CR=1 FL=1